MLNLDQARAGGEGMLSAKKKPDGKDKNVELASKETEHAKPALFESDEQPLHLAVPEGWSVARGRKQKRR
jgi:hypothetical protein